MKGLFVPRMGKPIDCRECPFMEYSIMTGRTMCYVGGKELSTRFRAIPFDGIPDWCELREVDVTPDRD